LTQAADGVEITVDIDYTKLKRRLSLVASGKTMTALNRHIGNVVLERVKDFLDEMAVPRHKTADRLGARHSKFYEYASGRVAGSPLKQTTVLKEADDKHSVVSIKNTPGLSRAYHDLVITPKRVGALTIPIDRISAHKGVKDLRKEGHEIFRPRGKNILAETRGKGKSAKLRPLYVLVKKVTVPRDEGLLPKDAKVREWATDAAEEYFTNMLELNADIDS
jgi:hypothetical protein